MKPQLLDNKAQLIALLCSYDKDFKFEYECRGILDIMASYTVPELETKLNAARGTPVVDPYMLGITGGQNEEFGDYVCIWLGPKGKLTVRPLKGEVPNAFRRWLMTVLLGVKWKKLEKRE